ncbi:MAG TPA: FG-GAP-like repeat-containing protein [Vicinamibacteria bacterium]
MTRAAAAAVAAGLAAALSGAMAWRVAAAARGADYRPALKPAETVERFLKDVGPGHDAFASEQTAAELQARLDALAAAIKAGPDRAAEAARGLLAPAFRGAVLRPRDDLATGRAGFEVRRARALPPDLTLDARAFPAELRRALEPLGAVATAEFLITAIEVAPGGETASTQVRYDLVGGGREAWRAQQVGAWTIGWTKAAAGWQAASWQALAHTQSRARVPVFREVTAASLGGTDSFRRQLTAPLDGWMATLDSVLARDSNGHHGVSVGDADGDGLDDLYVAQPSGLPNRLYRARGDGTFEDVTERAGVAVLDDTAQSLFADVDNDGDQDLVLATGTQPLLFENDGHGRFAPVADAFRFAHPLQGSLTSIAMADYDRDSFLDLYLCVYSYFYGAGEDKAGTPMPYHDARNGPPGVLFRNDGRGRFVEATDEAGLASGNDRYHFAAAWADYDEDGWPDLLVANDFGTKNLYRNRGRRDGKVTFEDVAEKAGVLDHGAGMSAAFLDYDNDGRLDIYTGNMWTAPGRRVTAHPAFMPDAPAEVRAQYARHTRGNALFRNRGDGGFDDVTLAARAEMGRWAWSSDALDFDSDGWDDLYVANGMLTREAGPEDLEGFFWRQVVARSPLSRVTGTPYDDAWRAINQLLIHRSIASRQRNVFLRNDGRGGFDDVSGAVGLDLDQDGRSFGVLDLDRDGDPDLAVMAARQAPQLRVFRNELPDRGAALAIRLAGTGGSNRDAVGARVTVETDVLRRTRIVQAGSGFLSQHTKELVIGLGPSRRGLKLTVAWPSGKTQAFTDVPLDRRFRLEEGGELRAEPFGTAPTLPAAAAAPAAAPPTRTWLFEPFPAPGFTAPDLRGETRSLDALRGRPAVLLFWAAGVDAGREALATLSAGAGDLARAGVGALALALDAPADAPKVRAAAAGAQVPVLHAPEDVALGYAILNRHLFMNRQDLRLPTAFLLDPAGRVVRAYRETLDVREILRDAQATDVPAAERLSRAVPFAGTLHAPPGARNYLFYGRELLDQGLDAAAVVAFERAAQASPSASTLYRLGTLLAKVGEADRARAAFERALALQPDLSEAHNDLGTLLAQSGDLAGAIERFRAALAAAPEYPDALNNLGYALLLSGRDAEARACYEKALALQVDFPEALNNLGMLLGRAGDLDAAERRFRAALAVRPDYGEAANNLALVEVGRGRPEAALALLQDFLARHPAYEGTYVTLAKIHLAAGREREGLAVLEQLLRRNPNHPQARQLLQRP